MIIDLVYCIYNMYKYIISSDMTNNYFKQRRMVKSYLKTL